MWKWIWDDKLNCYCAEHNPTIRADKNGDVFGGGGVEQPSPPAQPSTADAINAWVQSMPQVYQTQMQYAPLQAAQQVQLAQQYALPYGQALQTAQEAMYPGTTALQEQLAGQAQTGMTGQVPDWQRQQYLSNLRANLGTNIGSGIGADYTSRGLLQQNQDWQNYYRDLGLSLTGRQPLTQATTPATSDYMSNFTPATNMNYVSSTYSPYASAYANMYGTNASYQNNMFQNYMKLGQMGAGAVAGMM